MQNKLRTGVISVLSAATLVGAGIGIAYAEGESASAASSNAAADNANSQANTAAGAANNASDKIKAASTPGYGTRTPSYRAPESYRRPPQGYGRSPQRYRAPAQGYRTPSQGYRSPQGYRAPVQGYRTPRTGYGYAYPRNQTRPSYNRPPQTGARQAPSRYGYAPRSTPYGGRPYNSRGYYNYRGDRYRSRNDDDDGGLSFNMVDMIPLDDDTRLPWEGKHWKGMFPEKMTDKFGDRWDDMVNEPSKHKMPGGWYAPSIDAPNPAEVANEFDNSARDFKKNNQ